MDPSAVGPQTAGKLQRACDVSVSCSAGLAGRARRMRVRLSLEALARC